MDVSSLTFPDKEVQASVGLVFHSISRHSPDTAGSVMADFIPLVFLAIHTKTTEEGVWILSRFMYQEVTVLLSLTILWTLSSRFESGYRM